MTHPTQTAEQLQSYIETHQSILAQGKPILASWMGGAEVMEGEAILNRSRIPTYPYPDSAARVFNYMWKYSDNLRSLYETPAFLEEREGIPNRTQVEQIIHTAHQANRTMLTEVESKQILTAYGIPTVETRIATSEDEAVQYAENIGYPIVLKLHSKTITHKTDVGGVQLNLPDVEAVRQAYRAIAAGVQQATGNRQQAKLSPSPDFLGVTVQPMINLKDSYELIIGSSPDPQFGPVLLFGMGGELVEVFQDRAVAIPPLTTTLARRLMEQTKIYKALKGV
jgi:acetyltransferase